MISIFRGGRVDFVGFVLVISDVSISACVLVSVVSRSFSSFWIKLEQKVKLKFKLVRYPIDSRGPTYPLWIGSMNSCFCMSHVRRLVCNLFKLNVELM